MCLEALFLSLYCVCYSVSVYGCMAMCVWPCVCVCVCMCFENYFCMYKMDLTDLTAKRNIDSTVEKREKICFDVCLTFAEANRCSLLGPLSNKSLPINNFKIIINNNKLILLLIFIHS